MVRLLSVLVLTTSIVAAFSRAAAPPAKGPSKKPITTDGGEIGKLLKKWYAEGTAAGNVGDFYDNRDGEHSSLDMRPWPQLQKIVYTEADVKARRHWALAVVTRPHVTFGNSSTSAPPERGGSNPRTAYIVPGGLAMLHKQYRGNNLYIYPEHRDHDPGHNGKGDGYGDLYPANTPYLLTSQGSSGSDQPFMRAIPFTLAAFRPEVKKKLVASGLLMPTLQMILRSTNKHLANPKEYLTGKAHPTVFEGSWVDSLRMVKMAHDIRPESVPPIVQLKVIEETEQVAGRDFFEPAGALAWQSEKLADTPAAIARIWRGKDGQRKLIVSAEGSYDLNKRPLTYHWVVLRGDEKRITIKSRNKAGSVAEVTVGYHARRPIAPGSAMASNRVDIGVFVHNGAHYSAPGFLTFFSLDSEARTYDDKGRIREIGHGMGEATLTVRNTRALCDIAAGRGPAAKLLASTAEQRAALREAGPKHTALQVALSAAQAKLASARSEQAKGGVNRKAAEAAVRAAEKEVAKETAELNRFLDTKQAGLGASLRAFLDKALHDALRNPALSSDLAALWKSAPPGRKAAVEAARARLVGLGIAEKGKGPRLKLRTLRERLTAYERAMLERFHAVVLAELAFPDAVTAGFQENFVDQRLAVRKRWRDVYRYDASGALLGWVRYDGAKTSEFTPDGLLVLEKDARGRPIKARTVRYEVPRPYNVFANDRKPLAQALGDEVVTYEYDGDKGRVKSRDQAPPAK
jgi:hypothetical protein